MTAEKKDADIAVAPRLDALSPEVLEKVVVSGDLSKLTPAQRLEYYRARCASAGLDPVAVPFEYIVLNGKLTLYARKACSEQLSRIHGIKLSITDQRTENGMRVVTVRAETKDGRSTEEIGVVPITNLSGEALSNAFMKTVTKAKRRAVLSMCGLGLLDETETETVPGARMVRVDPSTGEILGEKPEPKSRATASLVEANKVKVEGTTIEVDPKTGEILPARKSRPDRPESAVDAIVNADEPTAEDLAPPRAGAGQIPALVEGIPVEVDWEVVKNEPFGGKNKSLSTKTPLEISEGYYAKKEFLEVAEAAMKNAYDIYAGGEHPGVPYQKMALAIYHAKQRERERLELDKCFQ